MNTFKHSSQDVIAVVTETTVYLSNLEGRIYKHFPINHFQPTPFVTKVEFPTDFEEEKKEYNTRQAKKNEEKKEAYNRYIAAKRETRKQEIVNIWNFRKGNISAFRIRTCNQPVELFGKNPNIEGVWAAIFFGTYNEAKELFDAAIGSWTPEFNESINNVQGEVSLYKCELDHSNRLEITSLSDLEDWFNEFNEEPIENEWFSPEIPEKALIVDLDEHRGSFNRKYYTVNMVQVKGDFTGSHTIGLRKMHNYSDLWGQVVFEDINDYIEMYISDEDAMQKLFDAFSFEDAKEYGLDKAYFYFYLYEKENEE